MSHRTDDHPATSADSRSRRRLRLPGRSPRTRSVICATGILVVGISPFALAATGDPLLEGKRNGTTRAETEVISNINATTGTKGGYSTRQSNLSASGGGAIYGCRSKAGGSAAKPPQNPCVRANNLSTGHAFEFNASDGPIAGVITAGAGGDTKKPFVTNATGVATGLNADRVDGLEGKAITDAIAAAVKEANGAKSRFITIRENEAGTGATIVAQSGGFKLVNCYTANGNCYIDAGSDVTKKSILAGIVTENGANDAGNDTQLTGSTSASACLLDTVACAPNGTDSNNGGTNGVFVVTPRDADGSDVVAGDRYTFTVQISGAEAA